MSPSHVFEPAYAELKHRVVSGVWRPGTRLEAHRLASDLGVSMTPVRDCLNRLVGERLVQIQYGQGFCVARLGEQDLRDLFSLNLALLHSACFLRASPAIVAPSEDQSPNIAIRTARLFEGLAETSGNRELVGLVGRLNERLHAVRRYDDAVIPDTGEELTKLEASAASESRADLSARLLGYHNRRIDAAAAFIKRLENRRN